MFETNILIKGKHATYVKFLSEKTKLLGEGTSKNGAGVFKRFVDTLLIAPIFGVLKNMRADEDKTSDDRANILAEQIIREKSNLDNRKTIVKLTNKGKSLDNKIKSVFKKYELIMSSSLSGKEKENLISYIDRLKNALKGGLENDKTNI